MQPYIKVIIEIIKTVGHVETLEVDFMNQQCRKSCGNCSDGTAPTTENLHVDEIKIDTDASYTESSDPDNDANDWLDDSSDEEVNIFVCFIFFKLDFVIDKRI